MGERKGKGEREKEIFKISKLSNMKITEIAEEEEEEHWQGLKTAPCQAYRR